MGNEQHMQPGCDKSAGAPMLVAVVDDDHSCLRSVGRLLRLNGYAVATYSSSLAFLNALPAVLPDCLIVDLHMPGLTGIDLLERMASRGFGVPSILVTAHETPATTQAAQRAGVLALLPKPFDGEVLLQTVKRIGILPALPETSFPIGS